MRLYTCNRYTHAHHVPHAEHMRGKFDQTKWRWSKHGRDDAVLRLRLSRPRVSEQSKSLGCWHTSRLLSRLSCLSSFCWAVNCLLCLWTCSGIIFYPPSPQPRRNLDATSAPSQWHHEHHVPNRYV